MSRPNQETTDAQVENTPMSCLVWGYASGGWFGTWDLPQLRLRHRSWALKPGTWTMRLVTGITLLLALGKWSGPKKEQLSWVKSKSRCLLLSLLPLFWEERTYVCFYVSVCFLESEHYYQKLSDPLLTEPPWISLLSGCKEFWGSANPRIIWTATYLWPCGSD